MTANLWRLDLARYLESLNEDIDGDHPLKSPEEAVYDCLLYVRRLQDRFGNADCDFAEFAESFTASLVCRTICMGW